MGKIGIMEILIIVVALGSIIPGILYLVSLQSTLNEVSIKNRRMQPGQVWLSLIPLFGLVWQFIMVSRIADSLRAEFDDRQIQIAELRPGYSVGLAYCVLFTCSIIPVLGFLTSIAGLICWIIYWVKTSDFRQKLIVSKFG
jgi:hypothetical protein